LPRHAFAGHSPTAGRRGSGPVPRTRRPQTRHRLARTPAARQLRGASLWRTRRAAGNSRRANHAHSTHHATLKHVIGLDFRQRPRWGCGCALLRLLLLLLRGWWLGLRCSCHEHHTATLCWAAGHPTPRPAARCAQQQSAQRPGPCAARAHSPASVPPPNRHRFAHRAAGRAATPDALLALPCGGNNNRESDTAN
jgi:hypothetical protein